MKKYSSLAISNPDKFYFGTCPNPVSTRRGLIIGGGTVYPEINFTLPSVEISDANFNDIRRRYQETLEEICKRAIDLETDGFVVEFETLIEMTTTPQIAIDITAALNDILEKYYVTNGLKTAIRITPNDAREMVRPPILRSGRYLESMLETFEGCARKGAELLSIESTGGKELHDEALLMCNIDQVMFSLISLGCRDMSFLWKQIDQIAKATGTITAGDTACGFGNTAMVLAEKKCIPKTFAAIVRVISAVRSLVAYEEGAVGPGKDCGYENVYIKAITGAPISMEGRMAACAHFSPLGNIAGAMCDLWSNESVQMIKLLGGMAPTVSIEQLVYDCRMMNTAIGKKQHLELRDILIDSDAYLDPQALILTPENVIKIANKMVLADNYYRAGIDASIEALSIIEDAVLAGKLKLPEIELPFIDTIKTSLSMLPSTEDEFIESARLTADSSKVILDEYILAERVNIEH